MVWSQFVPSLTTLMQVLIAIALVAADAPAPTSEGAARLSNGGQ